MKKNPFLDDDFLIQLNQCRQKEIFARIIALNFDEQPLELIEGRVTSGSINVDGNSAVRRTCSLGMIAKDVNITDFYWGVSNKFTLEIGVSNIINDDYPDIIWFPQGIFVIASFNSSLTNNNYSISITGKDKMCLLNGDVGGNLPSSIDFGAMDVVETVYTEKKLNNFSDYSAGLYYLYDIEKGEYCLSYEEYDPNEVYYTASQLITKKSLPIKDIILEAVHTYGKEPYHNIVINDLDECGLELLSYRGDVDLYFFYNEEIVAYDHYTLTGDDLVGKLVVNTYVDSKTHETVYELSDNDYAVKDVPIYNNGIDNFNADRSLFMSDYGNIYSITKVSNTSETDFSSSAIGYRATELTYAGDLISSIGETLTSILDKIKNMLGPFEYFYDVDGRFIFQAQKIYSTQSWNSLVETDGSVFAREAIEDTPYSYSFEDVNLIQKFTHTPAINNVKNDYSIWGIRTSVSGAEIPIHARYAIHEKPIYYKTFDGKMYIADYDIVNNLIEEKKEELRAQFYKKADSFTLQYAGDDYPYNLTRPEKQADGSWSAGWWDIRDWYNYYYLLTGVEPRYTMKWYSSNDLEGCVKINSIPGYESVDDTRYCWLIIKNFDGTYNFQHGSGNPSWASKNCYLYESYFDEASNRVITTRVLDSNGDVVRKHFIPPYSGCSDTHTYLEFLKNDVERDGNKVYFYHPSFPNVSSYEELIESTIQQEFLEYEAQGLLNYVDWRELIYRMAIDYYQHNQDGDFLYQVAQNNAKLDDFGSYYPTGETGYEVFYSDMQAFWRDLYNPEPEKILTYDSLGGEYLQTNFYAVNLSKADNPAAEFKTYRSMYYIPREETNKKIFDLVASNATYDAATQYYTSSSTHKYAEETYRVGSYWQEYEQLSTFESDYYLKPKDDDEIEDVKNYSATKYYWNKNVIEAPQLLNFWIDFYEGDDSLQQYQIGVIGDRSKVVNNSKITSVYFPEVPQVIFITPDSSSIDIDQRKHGYVYVQMDSDIADLFSISSRGKSAEEEMIELFNKHSYCTETISITSVPIYHLEPNTLIYIRNDENQLNGKYQVSKLTIPLTYNGMMSISATKIIDAV